MELHDVPPKPATVEERVKFFIGVMNSGRFDRRWSRTAKLVAKAWGMPVSTVQNYTAEASSRIVGDENGVAQRVREIRNLIVIGGYVRGLSTEGFAKRYGVSEETVHGYEARARREIQTGEEFRINTQESRVALVAMLERQIAEVLRVDDNSVDATSKVTLAQKHGTIWRYMRLKSQVLGLQTVNHNITYTEMGDELVKMVERVLGAEAAEKIAEELEAAAAVDAAEE